MDVPEVDRTRPAAWVMSDDGVIGAPRPDEDDTCRCVRERGARRSPFRVPVCDARPSRR
ncbi:hypothetical protein AB0I60_23040 [Actinosynnema sp. NPDC050436]|uniref:hypothetical protein n=1 Tax=Actinosynnema sp. NPDC050436 TaxID=3155659 RepID=UPI0033F7BC9F